MKALLRGATSVDREVIRATAQLISAIMQPRKAKDVLRETDLNSNRASVEHKLVACLLSIYFKRIANCELLPSDIYVLIDSNLVANSGPEEQKLFIGTLIEVISRSKKAIASPHNQLIVVAIQRALAQPKNFLSLKTESTKQSKTSEYEQYLTQLFFNLNFLTQISCTLLQQSFPSLASFYSP